MDNKIYVSELEYSRLCRVDGRMGVLIDYLKTKDYIDKEMLKLIVGIENFEESSSV